MLSESALEDLYREAGPYALSKTAYLVGRRDVAEEIVHEHRDLLEAILGGDPEHARAVSVTQALASQRMVLDGLLSTDAIMSANLIAPRQS